MKDIDKNKTNLGKDKTVNTPLGGGTRQQQDIRQPTAGGIHQKTPVGGATTGHERMGNVNKWEHGKDKPTK